MIKLLILDLDGTLLDNSKRIKECDKIAVLRALKSGVKVTVFTGRNFHSAKSYIEEIGVEIPVVFQNGALIYDFAKKSVMKMTLLDGGIARKLVERSKDKRIFPIVFRSFFSKRDMVVQGTYKGAYEYYFEHNSWRIVRVLDLLKAVPDFVSEVALVGYEPDVREVVSDLENVSIVKSTNQGEETFYEVLGEGCTKANALSFLEDQFGVSKEDVMFVGDGYNDLEMMESVGVSVAMANAPEDVKRKAVWVTSSNEDCGVAKAIEKFILK